MPNTGMAVTIDIGDAKDIHPKNKQEVGRRLAQWALAKTYGKDVAACGPLYKSMRVDGDRIDHRVRLRRRRARQSATASKLKGFAIAGADQKFVWADAQIVGNTVVVPARDQIARRGPLCLGEQPRVQPGQQSRPARLALPHRRLELNESTEMRNPRHARAGAAMSPDCRAPIMLNHAWTSLCLLLSSVLALSAEVRGADPATPSQPDAVDAQIVRLKQAGFPLVDFHVHLKGGLTIDEAVALSRRSGIRYGIAANCGLKFPITDDRGIEQYIESLKGQPVFIGMQAEGREWPRLFSKETVAKFDYVFTDAMTIVDHRGRPARLWIKDEVDIPDKQAFMELLVKTIVGIMDGEPIDIYANPTYLPDVLAAEYDAVVDAGPRQPRDRRRRPQRRGHRDQQPPAFAQAGLYPPGQASGREVHLRHQQR